MKNSRSSDRGVTRRQFIQTSTVVAGTLLLPRWTQASPRGDAPVAAASVKRTAADQVTLGKTGIKLSRLGFGTGSDNGAIQTANGKPAFVDVIHYAYDQGITYIDTAESYHTFGWIADATKGLPREKLFIQSKVDNKPADVLAVVDRHRKTFNTDYVDSLLIHCMTHGQWTDEFKRIMDGFSEAQSRKWIRAKGVSCHSLPALRAAAASDWTEVHLVRVNPQGVYTDTEDSYWGEEAHDVTPVVAEIKNMHAKGHGVIGMKIYGAGTFTNAADRDQSVKFAMSHPEIDAIVIGLKNRQEVDEAIARVNRMLQEV